MSLTFEQFKKLPAQDQLKIRKELNQMYLLNTQRSPTKPKPEYVSPETARKHLAIPVPFQRDYLEKTIEFYADLIISGRWEDNGESVSCAPNDGLLNGRQRYSAISLCDVGIPIHVVRNVNPSTFWSMDQHSPRTGPQVLKSHSIKNGHKVAPAVHFLLRYLKNQKLTNVKGSKISKDELIKTALIDHPGLITAVDLCNNKATRNVLSPSIAAFCYYIFTQIDEKDCSDFFRYLITGLNIAESNPIRLLRDALMSYRSSRSVTTSHDKVVVIFKCWNAWRSKKRFTKSAFIKDMDRIPKPV